MAIDLRCDSKLHGVIDLESNTIEEACNSRFCGAGRGVVVLHRFDLRTGVLVDTRKFKSPTEGRNSNG